MKTGLNHTSELKTDFLEFNFYQTSVFPVGTALQYSISHIIIFTANDRIVKPHTL